MKNYFLYLFPLFFLASCSQEEENGPDYLVHGSWEKIEIDSPISDSSVFDEEIGYHETYYFFRNTTFSKFNSKTGVLLSGYFSFSEPSEIQSKEISSIVSLRFNLSELRIKASQIEEVTDEFCSACPSFGSFVYGWGSTESLHLYHDGRLVNPGPCCFNDLPVYFYRKVD
jgi:hypothetical protein